MASSNRETAAWRPVRATTRITDGIPKIPGGMHGGGIRPDTARKNTKLLHALMKKGPIMGTSWSRRRAGKFVRRGKKRMKREQILMSRG